MAKINYEKLENRVCVYCGSVYKPTGPAQKNCLDCKRKIDNLDRQVSLDIARFKKFGTYEGIGQGNSQGWGELHHSYSSGWCFFKRTRRELLVDIGKCERCGKVVQDDNKPYFCLHHKDHNRSNNTRGNFELLCRRCHQLHHGCIDNLPNLSGQSATTISSESTPKQEEAVGTLVGYDIV